jgi:RNA polymerase sigma-70 factor (ECF subfamily)
MIDGASDAELARTIQERTSDARAEEAELCRRLEPRVRLYGRKHLRSDDAAAELVQQVMLRLIESLRAGSVREPDRIASFALGMARNVAQEIRRHRAKRANFDEEGHAPTTRAEPDDPLETRRVTTALQTLDERSRTVVVLTFYGDRSTGEIAEALGLTPGNVRVIRHRALQALREQLREPS